MIKHLSSSMPTLYQPSSHKFHIPVSSHSTRNQLRASCSYPALNSASIRKRAIDGVDRPYNIHLYFENYFSAKSDDTISHEEIDQRYETLISTIISQYENAQTEEDLFPLAISARHYSSHFVTDLEESKLLLEDETLDEYALYNSLIQHLKAIYYLTSAISRQAQTDADDTLLLLWQQCLTLTLDTVISHYSQPASPPYDLDDIKQLAKKIISDSKPDITKNERWFNTLNQQLTSLEKITSSANTEKVTEEVSKQDLQEESSSTFELIHEERSLPQDTMTHKTPPTLIIPMQEQLKEEVKKEKASQHCQITTSKQNDCEDTLFQCTFENRVYVSHMLDVTRKPNRQGKVCQIIIDQIRCDEAEGVESIAAGEEVSAAVATLPDSSFPKKSESPTPLLTTIGICLDDKGFLFGQAHEAFLPFIETLITKKITAGGIKPNNKIKIILYRQKNT